MNDEAFKLIGITIVAAFIIYMVIKMFQLQVKVVEGLANQDDSSTAPTSGEAGTSTSYAAAIKAQVVKLQDELLISKYRKDYETVIINLDDYISFLMIKQTLNMKVDGDVKSNIEAINSLNSLKTAKDSLNVTMKFLDSQ
jgi:hypothetical protein